MNSRKDDEFGAITMPTMPSTGRIRKQNHDTRMPGEGYSSSDDDKASGYGKTQASRTDHSHRNYGKMRGKVY